MTDDTLATPEALEGVLSGIDVWAALLVVAGVHGLLLLRAWRDGGESPAWTAAGRVLQVVGVSGASLTLGALIIDPTGETVGGVVFALCWVVGVYLSGGLR